MNRIAGALMVVAVLILTLVLPVLGQAPPRRGFAA